MKDNWRAALIVPYFGKLPNYFQLVLNSCRGNGRHCDWLIFTDDRTPYEYPENVKVRYMGFDALREMIQAKFDFPIALHRPYKLCDFRPAYGYIFADWLCGYDYWGHCDIDCIYGSFDDFLNEDILDCDKVMRLGHLTLYRNTPENNRRFMLPVNGAHRYREVFSAAESCIFDEENADNRPCIRDIWRHYSFSEYRNDAAIANTAYKSDIFRLVVQTGDGANYVREARGKSIFYWDHGKLLRLREEEGRLERREYMYIHLMKRPMKLPRGDMGAVYKIIPNSFVPAASIPQDVKSFRREKWRNWNLQYFRTRYQNLRAKLSRLLRGKTPV